MALTECIEYITKDGDRWDTIAWDMYGDALLYAPIIVANSQVPITPILPANIKLYIPIIDNSDAPGPEGMPPWK